LVQKSSIKEIYNAIALPVLLMREKFGPLRGKKKDKKQDINRDIIFQKNGRLDPFFPQKELKTFWNS